MRPISERISAVPVFGEKHSGRMHPNFKIPGECLVKRYLHSERTDLFVVFHCQRSIGCTALCTKAHGCYRSG